MLSTLCEERRFSHQLVIIARVASTSAAAIRDRIEKEEAERPAAFGAVEELLMLLPLEEDEQPTLPTTLTRSPGVAVKVVTLVMAMEVGKTPLLPVKLRLVELGFSATSVGTPAKLYCENSCDPVHVYQYIRL